MSSTNRGYDRHATDYYVTPKNAVRIFLKTFREDVLKGEFIDDTTGFAQNPQLCEWLDPCAGGDGGHDMTYPYIIKEMFDPEILTTIDIRADSRAERKEDYLTAKIDIPPDIIITNPPFYIAKEVIEKGLQDVKTGGYVIMLLRLNFFGSQERFKFFQRQLPILSYVHHRRFSFTDNGKTDSIEYMHTVFQKDSSPVFTMLKVI